MFIYTSYCFNCLNFSLYIKAIKKDTKLTQKNSINSKSINCSSSRKVGLQAKEQYKKKRQIEDKDKSNTWKWLKKRGLKACTEALIFSAQEQSLRTNYVKFYIDKTGESPLCRMCRVENEIVSHIYCE